MGVDLERGPVSTLDNKTLTENMADSNKVSESIKEKTAKLHRLLGDSDKEKGFHLGNHIEIFSNQDVEIVVLTGTVDSKS